MAIHFDTIIYAIIGVLVLVLVFVFLGTTWGRAVVGLERMAPDEDKIAKQQCMNSCEFAKGAIDCDQWKSMFCKEDYKINEETQEMIKCWKTIKCDSPYENCICS